MFGDVWGLRSRAKAAKGSRSHRFPHARPFWLQHWRLRRPLHKAGMVCSLGFVKDRQTEKCLSLLHVVVAIPKVGGHSTPETSAQVLKTGISKALKFAEQDRTEPQRTARLKASRTQPMSSAIERGPNPEPDAKPTALWADRRPCACPRWCSGSRATSLAEAHPGHLRAQSSGLPQRQPVSVTSEMEQPSVWPANKDEGSYIFEKCWRVLVFLSASPIAAYADDGSRHVTLNSSLAPKRQ